jgi:hypothetical protein
MCLIAEISMLIFGIVVLVQGKFSLTPKKVVYGVPARIIGGICMFPLPLAFLIGFTIGLGKAVQGQQFGAKDATMLAPIEAGLIVLVLLVALVIALATAEPPRRKKRKRIEDEYEDDSDYRNRRNLEFDDPDEDEDQPPRRPHLPDGGGRE